MKITSWNVRGLSAPNKKRLVKRFLYIHNPDVLLLQETKLGGDKTGQFINSFSKWDGFFHDVIGSAGGLGVVWNPATIEVVPIASHENWMACEIKCIGTNFWFPIFNVYGLTNIEDKLKVWREIIMQETLVEKDRAIIAGGFNALLDVDEKGGLRKCSKVMERLRDFIENNKLMDIILKNGKFT
ncbi:uncharacterized protein LOC131858236 [Cryptomeria japonica]|uniref:uncharacterized protein LOC131858236 n=1 Tax=Cryptomeria japonica TaxID=3369 RepID=UPI0027DA67F2|nr:uncharacterized protein LOC131858236 [Cryptomeria japonica]